MSSGTPPAPRGPAGRVRGVAGRPPRLDRPVPIVESRGRRLGHVHDQELLADLWAHCAVYLHGHSVGGTNPALLQALGAGSPTLALDTPFNREVLRRDDQLYPQDAAARAALTWERVWPALWPATGIAGLFIAAALFGLPQFLPWPLHALVLAGCITAMGLSLYFNLENFRLPDWHDGARRIERDSTLVHRPISEGEDVLSAGDGDAWAQALWNAHLSRRLADFGKLRGGG